MSQYELIPDEAFDNAPEDEGDKFVFLAKTAQTNFQRMLDSSNANEYSNELQNHFVATVSAMATALGIEGLPPVSLTPSYGDYTRFQVALSAIITTARIKSQTISRPFSVELGRVSKGKIRQEIDSLKHYIQNSDLDEKKKSALIDKLDDMLEELEKKRLSFARTMAIAASIMGTIGGSAGAIAAAPRIPEGVSYIVSLIGVEKAEEEEEYLRLSAPVRALTPPASDKGGFNSDFDDDVPF